jgi:simple sugar transport system permease protein
MVVVAFAGRDPILAMSALAEGAFGTRAAILHVLTKCGPLLLTGLAVLVAFRAGFWNIGAEGQFVCGAIAAGWLGTRVAPAFLLQPAILAIAFGAGALWCLLAAWLRVRRGALEVISTIMLNFLALHLLSWLVHGPLRQTSGAQPIGDAVTASAALPRLFGRTHTLHAGVLLAIVAVFVLLFVLTRTEWGFRLRMVGANPRAAAWAGVPVARVTLQAAAVSGGIAALAGALEVLGVLGRLFDKVSPGYGYTAIAVALLARLQPLALFPAALFFAALDAGSSRMQQEADVSYVLVLVVQAVVVLASIASTRAPAAREIP